MRAVLREASKLLGGSALVYALLAGLPADQASPGQCGPEPSAVQGPVPVQTAQAQQAGSRLAPTYLEGADGSRQFLGWRDVRGGFDCTFEIAADASWRCLPAGAGSGVFFADSACTRPLAVVSKGCAPPPFALATNAPACASRRTTRVFHLGDRFTEGVAYWVVAGACSGVSSPDLVLSDLYLVGDEVLPSEFVEGTAQVEP